ncbi:hypothetical protein ACRALDRAFT_1094745 [Sodiomyces alcalophilus JCM 7366]|uniref:uncharacterized protein n=1 Tax=Sodiomyces alcalophilus JCM 7366 TaxID=591952 RepID=UPI0039B5EE0C
MGRSGDRQWVIQVQRRQDMGKQDQVYRTRRSDYRIYQRWVPIQRAFFSVQIARELGRGVLNYTAYKQSASRIVNCYATALTALSVIYAPGTISKRPRLFSPTSPAKPMLPQANRSNPVMTRVRAQAAGENNGAAKKAKADEPGGETSFNAIPPIMHSTLAELTTTAGFLAPLISKAATQRRITTLPPWTHDTARLATSRPSTLWALASASLLSEGYVAAGVYFILAILINHVRRMLAPWVGTLSGACFVHSATPLSDLKLAVGSADVFLDEVLSCSALGDVVGAVVVKGCLELLAALAVRRLVDGRSTTGKEVGIGMDVARLGFVVWMLAGAEYAQARSCRVIAVVAAWGKLVLGSRDHRVALGHVLARHGWAKVLAHGWSVGLYLCFGVVPLFRGAVGEAARGRIGLLGMLGAVVYVTYLVTRYSNKYYMILELWGLVMVCWWVVVGVVVLGAHWVWGHYATRDYIRWMDDLSSVGIPQPRLNLNLSSNTKLYPNQSSTSLFRALSCNPPTAPARPSWP